MTHFIICNIISARGDINSMRVSSIQSNCSVPSYKGSFFKEGAFERLENSLTGSDKDTFESIIKNIEDTNDDHSWWFDTQSIRNGRLKLAIIGQFKKDGTPIKPGCFLDEAKNSLELFKKLSTWYKNNVEGYKGDAF